MEGKVLPEYDNRPFVNLAIPIQESIQSVRKYLPSQIMRYIRSATNSEFLLIQKLIFHSDFVNWNLWNEKVFRNENWLRQA